MTDGDNTSDGIGPKRPSTRTDKIAHKNNKSRIPTKVGIDGASQKSKIPIRGYKCNNDIYSITPAPKISGGSSESSVSVMETETEKHLSWDSGNNEEMNTTWFPEETDNNSCSPPPSWTNGVEHQDVNSLSVINNNDVSDASDAKILSWHTLSIMTLQNMIIDQSEKIKQLEMNCHLQEILMKNQKDEIDLYQERVDQLEMQGKEDREDKQFVIERIETLESLIRYPRVDEEKLIVKINSLEHEIKTHREDKLLLLERIEALEHVIDEHKEEMDMLLERIDDSMKTHGKEMDYLSDRADNTEELAAQNKKERTVHTQRLDNIEGIIKNISNDAMELVSERIDNLVVAFEQNKKEKEILLERIEEEIELFLERVANLEVALHNAQKSGGILDSDHYSEYEGVVTHTQEAISDLHTKVIDTYTDTEAALNVIHNMLHKDKLTKII